MADGSFDVTGWLQLEINNLKFYIFMSNKEINQYTRIYYQVETKNMSCILIKNAECLWPTSQSSFFT